MDGRAHLFQTGGEGGPGLVQGGGGAVAVNGAKRTICQLVDISIYRYKYRSSWSASGSTFQSSLELRPNEIELNKPKGDSNSLLLFSRMDHQL